MQIIVITLSDFLGSSSFHEFNDSEKLNQVVKDLSIDHKIKFYKDNILPIDITIESVKIVQGEQIF